MTFIPKGDIKELDCSDEFRQLNFEQSSYKNEQQKVIETQL